MVEECAVCNILLKTCEELGDKKFCSVLLEELKKDKITEQELSDKIAKRFGSNFGEAWDKNVETVFSKFND